MNDTLAPTGTIELEEIIVALAQNGFDPSVSHAESIQQRLDASAITAAADRSLALRAAIQKTMLGTPSVDTLPMIDLDGDRLLVYGAEAMELPDYVGVARDRRTSRLVLTTLQTGVRDIAFLDAATIEEAVPEAEALMPNLAATEWVYYSPKTYSIIDEIRPNGLTLYGRESFPEIISRYPDVIKISFDRALELHAHRYLDEPAKQISEEDWHSARNMTPPLRWRNDGATETFLSSEPLTFNVTRVYARIGDDYFRFNGRTSMSHDEIVTTVKGLYQTMPAEPTTEATL
ncbi:hypothetical protein [Ralstonia sp. ASV6]|uniref:hypothetical protein n=1 Tax=Ralstonia sp. ASV6 TaxID=2795124 RepID=UPI0018EB43FC|nr:hypothetical protein [Ralstonia sp. ASV6]